MQKITSQDMLNVAKIIEILKQSRELGSGERININKIKNFISLLDMMRITYEMQLNEVETHEQ